MRRTSRRGSQHWSRSLTESLAKVWHWKAPWRLMRRRGQEAQRTLVNCSGLAGCQPSKVHKVHRLDLRGSLKLVEGTLMLEPNEPNELIYHLGALSRFQLRLISGRSLLRKFPAPGHKRHVELPEISRRWMPCAPPFRLVKRKQARMKSWRVRH